MPIYSNIWSTIVQRFPGAEGHVVPPIGAGDDGNSKVAMMLYTGQLKAATIQIAVGLSRSLKL